MLELSRHGVGGKLMKERTSRRSFLRAAGAAGIAVVCPRCTGRQDGPPGGRRKKRLAMVIDMRKCQGREDCTKCSDACHRVHNVPTVAAEGEEVKWIWKEPFGNALPGQEHAYLEGGLGGKPVVVLCNHCARPPCVRVCPTAATWKRESDGVVMMDQHRCIGCRYCMVACPYGARSFNWSDPREHLDREARSGDFPTRTRGVVEKCNFCADRLARGIPVPACVEACPEKALVFGDLEVKDSEIRKLLDSRYTIRRRPGLGTEPHVFYLV